MRRAAAAAATLAIHAAIAAGLIWGLSFSADDAPPRETDLVTVDLEPPPPPPPPPPPRAAAAARKPAGDAGAKARALPREAPETAQPLAVAPAAPVAGEGREADAGAGTQGQGAGAGAGLGDGGGGNGGRGSPAQRIAGALRDSDYPRGEDAAGTTAISFRVRTDGRVDRCTVLRSSGSARLDQLTCRLFTERYRFRPATNGRGEATESALETSFTWGTRRR